MTILQCHVKDDRRFRITKTRGDCLEGIGIPDGGSAIVDHASDIQVGDVVHCTKMPGALNSYIKVVEETGDDVLVGTRYLDSSRDFQFVAGEIYGVVIAFLDNDGNIVWTAERKVI